MVSNPGFTLQIKGLIIQVDLQEGIKALENATKVIFDTISKLSMEESCINEAKRLLGDERWNQLSATYMDEQDKKKKNDSDKDKIKWTEV